MGYYFNLDVVLPLFLNAIFSKAQNIPKIKLRKINNIASECKSIKFFN